MDDRVKAAIAGFNFGLMGYVMIRWFPTLFGRGNIDMGWMFTQIMIGAVIGIVTGGIAYFAMSRK